MSLRKGGSVGSSTELTPGLSVPTAQQDAATVEFSDWLSQRLRRLLASLRNGNVSVCKVAEIGIDEG